MNPSRRTSRVRAAALAAALLLLALAPAGCASFAANARAGRLVGELDRESVELPLDEIWAQVPRFLAERRYDLAGRDAEAGGQETVDLLGYLSRAKETAPTKAGGLVLETGWDGRRIRYVVEAVPVGTAWQVHFTAVHEDLTEHGHDGERRRDPDMELAFLRRLAPERADAVLARVDGAAAGAPVPAPAKSPP